MSKYEKKMKKMKIYYSIFDVFIIRHIQCSLPSIHTKNTCPPTFFFFILGEIGLGVRKDIQVTRDKKIVTFMILLNRIVWKNMYVWERYSIREKKNVKVFIGTFKQQMNGEIFVVQWAIFPDFHNVRETNLNCFFPLFGSHFIALKH